MVSNTSLSPPPYKDDDSDQDDELRVQLYSDSCRRKRSRSPKDSTRGSRRGAGGDLVLHGTSNASSSSSSRGLFRREVEGCDVEDVVEDEEIEKPHEEQVTWMSLPHKGQLAVLTLARLSEPLVQTSLQAYMFYQLKSFDPSLSDAVIAGQAGMLAGSFTAAQFLTAMIWGRISDADWAGRKVVLLSGLFGTMISVLGFGFARTFSQAVFFRTLGGALNGNVGVMRTMISEIVHDKKYQSRAFLLLPLCFNIGVIVGPIMGGLLADPVTSYPLLFGDIEWLKRYPYSPPNIVSAFILLTALIGVFFALEETHPSLRDREDFGKKCGRKIADLFHVLRGKKHKSQYAYTAISDHDGSFDIQDDDDDEAEETVQLEPAAKHPKRKGGVYYRSKLPFRRIFTYNVTCTLIAHFLLGFHLGGFNNLWFVFLSTPVADPAHPSPPDYKRRLPFIFTGGLGMPPRDVGFAMAILGCIGINMQLFVYPHIQARLGVIRSWRLFMFAFPIAYTLVPFLSLVPSKTPPPAEKDGILVWISICGVLFVQVIARTFVLPAMTILVNNCSPHPSVLGTVHGIGQSVGSAARTVGPTIGGALYGVGLSNGVVGAVWWLLAGLGIVNCFASLWVREGDGHEIVLEGDEEAQAEYNAQNQGTGAV